MFFENFKTTNLFVIKMIPQQRKRYFRMNILLRASVRVIFKITSIVFVGQPF